MKTVRELHDEAMRLANLAMVARHKQDWPQAEALARQSYEYELQAAELLAEGKESEPTRSILYRSSASLAYQFKDFATAQRECLQLGWVFVPLHLPFLVAGIFLSHSWA